MKSLTAGKDDSEEIKLLMQLLKFGEDLIKPNKHKDVVLLLGNTGAGKTTFSHFIAGDNNNLISKETADGSFIIIDTNNKISVNSTIISQTVYPELIVDQDTDTAFYDCPGFSDTRSLAHDITSTLFIKRVIDYSNRAKLVFVVNSPSLREGMYRNDFILLVKHAVTFIKDIDKYSKSIAIVSTKVDNTPVKVGNSYQLVPDSKIIDGIVDFLVKVKYDLLNHEYVTDKSFTKKAAKFVDILLERNAHGYERIGIFRRPDESGHLNNILLLQEGKKSLQNMIFNNLNYVHIENDDFGYTISDESKNKIHLIAEEINISITKEIFLLGDDIKKHLEMEENKTQDIFVSRDSFKQASKSLELVNKPTVDTKATEFLNQIFLALNVSIPSERTANIERYDEYLSFLDAVSYRKTTNPLLWQEGVTDIKEYFRDSEKWYDFITKFYTWLTSYCFQQDITNYDPNNVEILCSEKNHCKINIDKFVMGTSCETSHNLKPFSKDINDIELSDSRIGTIHKILKLAITDKIVGHCPTSNKLIIRGQLLRITDINKFQCNGVIESIQMSALHKLFIDGDLYKPELQLSLIAPAWEVIGDRNILLEGTPGSSLGKARSGSVPGENGADGIPGLPGGPGGYFLGITDSIIGGTLSISVDGGKGGPGQEGGDGAVGINGEDVTHLQPTGLIRGKTLGGWKRLNNRLVMQSKLGYVRGQKAGDGGSSGNGGVGGAGGFAGKAVIHDFSNSGKILVSQRPGPMGDGGKAGKPGNGGVHGKCQEISKVVIIINNALELNIFVVSGTEYCGTSNDGVSGIDNYVSSFKTEPKEPVYSDPSSSILDNYKVFLSENMPGSVRLNIFNNFSKKLQELPSDQNRYRRNAAVECFLQPTSAKNAASNLNEFSILNQIFNAVSNGINFIKKINPYKKMENKMIFMDKGKFNSVELHQNDYVSRIVTHPELNQERMAIGSLISKDNNNIEGFVNHSVYAHSNLLLWNVLIKSFQKQNSTYNHSIENSAWMQNLEEESAYSHNMAYGHYASSRK